jgi:hypothetical protein
MLIVALSAAVFALAATKYSAGITQLAFGANNLKARIAFVEAVRVILCCAFLLPTLYFTPWKNLVSVLVPQRSARTSFCRDALIILSRISWIHPVPFQRDGKCHRRIGTVEPFATLPA